MFRAKTNDAKKKIYIFRAIALHSSARAFVCKQNKQYRSTRRHLTNLQYFRVELRVQYLFRSAVSLSIYGLDYCTTTDDEIKGKKDVQIKNVLNEKLSRVQGTSTHQTQAPLNSYRAGVVLTWCHTFKSCRATSVEVTAP